MLERIQIERLILHTEKSLDDLPVDCDKATYRRGIIDGLVLVLTLDPATINNKPINKEK